jgi:cob(I)alamin adenosyltransferase
MTDGEKRTDPAGPHYTRHGDAGTTSLGELGPVGKDDLRLSTYAECGEANAAIGLALAMSALPVQVVTTLSSLQHDLFDLVTGITHPNTQATHTPVSSAGEAHITQAHIERVEGLCDHYGADLKSLGGHVLPGGTVTAALLFRAWSATLRAERTTWHAHRTEPDAVGELEGRYLNRLASLLFVLARAANDEHGDTIWYPMASVTREAEATTTMN